MGKSGCLDLIAGPVVANLDRRDERLSSSLRQFPLSGSRVLSEEQLKMYIDGRRGFGKEGA